MTATVIDWLNNNAGFLSLVFAFTVAMSTVAYVTLTWRLVQETRRMRRAQTEPYIVVGIEPSEVWINFVILYVENTGSGVAKNVRFAIKKDIEGKGTRALSDIGFIKHGIPRMASGKKVSTFLMSMVDQVGQDRSLGHLSATLGVTYGNVLGEEIEDEIEVGFQHMEGMSTIGGNPLRDIARSMDALEKIASAAATGLQRLQVDAYDHDDREQEEAARTAFLEEKRAEWRAENATDTPPPKNERDPASAQGPPPPHRPGG